MTYKDVFSRAFSDIYTRFPLSDTETICRNVTELAEKLQNSKIKRYKAVSSTIKASEKPDRSLVKTVSAVAAVSVVLGAVVGLSAHFYNKGLDITTPGYAQKQAEIEASKALDKHQITDEERSESGTTEVGLTAELGDMNVKVLWYRFDGTDLIIKYSVTFFGDIPENLDTLPRPTANVVNYPDGRETLNCPSFEKCDIAYRDGNTFCMYSKISPVSKPVESLDIAIDNRRIDNENSPYLFTAIANIPEDKQPIEIVLDKYITIPEESEHFGGNVLHLTKLTIKSDQITFWYDDIPDSFDDYTIAMFLTSGQYAQAAMNDGTYLVFDGGYSGGDPYYSCHLTDESAVDPRDVSEVYLCGELIYLKSNPENDISGKYAESIEDSSNIIIYIDTTPYGKVRLDTLSLSPYKLELTFTPVNDENPAGGGIVRTQDLSIRLYYHDGSVSDISDMPHGFGEEIFADGQRKRTITYDLSDNRVAPQYIGYITINGAPVEISEAGSYDTKEYRGSSSETDNSSDIPFPSAIDAQNIQPIVQDGGIVGTVIDRSITPSENWITLPPENKEGIANP